jgi:hypothetical protein
MATSNAFCGTLCRGHQCLSAPGLKALVGFEDRLAIVPCDAPSKLFLDRIAHFRVTVPSAEWNGVWSLVEK